MEFNAPFGLLVKNTNLGRGFVGEEQGREFVGEEHQQGQRQI